MSKVVAPFSFRVLAPVSGGPAWRQGRTVGQFAPIPGTAMSLLPGVDSLTIDGYQGLISTDDSLVSMGAGGHMGYQNGIHELPLLLDAPKWITRNPSSPFSAVQSDALRAGPPPLYVYSDLKPCGSQTYSWTWYVKSLGRFVRLFVAAPHNLIPGPLNRIHSARKSDWQFDPDGTWPDGIIFNGAYHSTAAQDPTTEVVYIGNEYAEFFKWDPAQVSPTSHGFSRLSIPGAPIFGYSSSFMDTKRKRWVRLGAGIQYIDTADFTPHSIPGDAWTNDYAALANEPPGSVYDPDRDLYVALCNNGKVYTIGPNDAKGSYVQTLADIPFQNTIDTSNGWNTRAKYIPSVGGIVCVPRFNADAYFMPTRA